MKNQYNIEYLTRGNFIYVVVFTQFQTISVNNLLQINNNVFNRL